MASYGTVASNFPWLIQPNPGEYALAARRNAIASQANFLRGVQLRQNQQQIDMDKEAAQLQKSKMEKDAAAVAELTFKASQLKTPEETYGFFRDNAAYLANPATRQLSLDIMRTANDLFTTQTKTEEYKQGMEEKKRILSLRDRYGNFNVDDPDQVKAYQAIDSRNQFKQMLIDTGVDPNKVNPMELASAPLLPNGMLNVPDARSKALRLAEQQGMEVTGANVTLEKGQMFLKRSPGASNGRPRELTDIESAQFKAEMDSARTDEDRVDITDKWKIVTGEMVYIYDKNNNEYIVDWDKVDDYLKAGYSRNPSR